MTENNFKRYIRSHKPNKIKPHDFGGFDIYFDNGKKISISCGYDGIVYTHQREMRKIKDCNKALIRDLSELAPNFIKTVYVKYSKPFTMLDGEISEITNGGKQ